MMYGGLDELEPEGEDYLERKLVSYSDKPQLITSAVSASTYAESKDGLIDELVDDASSIIGKDVGSMAFGVDLKRMSTSTWGNVDCVYTDSEGELGVIRIYAHAPKDRDLQKDMRRIGKLGLSNDPIALYPTGEDMERQAEGYRVVGRSVKWDEVEQDEQASKPTEEPYTVQQVRKRQESSGGLRHHLGEHDSFICIDDAYKERIGKDWYVRIAAVRFERSDDLKPYALGDHDAFAEKIAQGEMIQYDLIVSNIDFDPHVERTALKAIEELMPESGADVYACNFFKPTLSGKGLDIQFGSGHHANKYKPFVKVADMATKWEEDPLRQPTDFIQDLSTYWRANRDHGAEDEFELDGHDVSVSRSIRRRR